MVNNNNHKKFTVNIFFETIINEYGEALQWFEM